MCGFEFGRDTCICESLHLSVSLCLRLNLRLRLN